MTFFVKSGHASIIGEAGEEPLFNHRERGSIIAIFRKAHLVQICHKAFCVGLLLDVLNHPFKGHAAFYRGFPVGRSKFHSIVRKCLADFQKGLVFMATKYVGSFVKFAGDDNTAVAMVTEEDGNIYAKIMGFIPEGRIDYKKAKEKVDYRSCAKRGECIACGDEVIDYGEVERFILTLEEQYGVEIQQVGYDRWNAISTVQKLEAESITCVEIKQHSSVLHMPTKLLKEAILEKMRKNGPVTDYMLGTVRENTHKGSLINWAKSFR